jgi:aminodeoxyfutalosine synthase
MIVEKELPQTLLPIFEKLRTKERLSFEDGLALMQSPYVEELGALADSVRKKKVGDIVYYASTLYIHPTNLCELSCPLCSFYAKPGWKNAWFMTPEQVEAKVLENRDKDLTEIHIVGGLWRDCNLDYYKEVFTKIKAIDPNLHIKALTPVEYDFLSRLHGISVEEVFDRMMEWGLGSLPGGGAEILVEEIRKKIAPKKITSERYLEIHKIAHTRGLRSNITMLFGHIEEPEHIITHLLKVRDLQDATGGFQTFVPLKYHEDNNTLGKRKERLKPKDIRKIYGISRLLLDNIRNIKVLWNYVGIEEAKELLFFGANDIAATSLEEKIITMAGGIRVSMTDEYLAACIRQVNRIPKKIHSGYDYCLDDTYT